MNFLEPEQFLTRNNMQERFALLSEAYNVLMDPAKREEYFKEVRYALKTYT